MRTIRLIAVFGLAIAGCSATREQETLTKEAALAQTRATEPTDPPPPAPTTLSTATPSATSTLTRTPRPSAAPSNTPPATFTPIPGWQTFQAEGLALSYPVSWLQQQDVEGIPGSQPPLLVLVHDSGDGTNVSLASSPVDEGETVDQIEGSIWQAQLSLYSLFGLEDQVEVLSVDTIEVGEKSALQREFSAPGLQDPSIIFHKLQVVFIDDGAYYLIAVTAPDVIAFGRHRADIAGIIASIQLIEQ